MRVEPRWISLCCGLAATECRAMTGRFPPVARMGGKRSYSDGVLDILGTWPKRWLLVDADLAIVEFWQAAFLGLLPAVAEVIRNAPADGEELWRLWTSEPVPVDPVERIARWQVAQAGQHAGVPVASDGEQWTRIGGPLSWKYPGDAHPRAATALKKRLIATMTERVARWIVCQKGNFHAKPVSFSSASWTGLAGQSSSGGATADLVPRIVKRPLAARVQTIGGIGEALFLDLATSSPVVNPGDLVTIDPPYEGTSGYGSALPRARVVELAQEAHERGARVLVHEAEPVIEGGPWRSLELRRTRGKGQRTWSRQKAEWVTINFEPATAHPGAAKDRAATRREMAPISGPLFEVGS